MKYFIEFELPDNETVLENIKVDCVNWSIWGYNGSAKAKPLVHCKDCKHSSATNGGFFLQATL